jgi:hypothetical protein
MGVVTSQHKQVLTSQFCVGDLDPSEQNWSDILCRDNMSPTCCGHVANMSATFSAKVQCK